MLRLDLDIEGADALGTAPTDGPLIVLCRHASMVDTLVPAKLLFDRGYRVRYVLKDELLWDPALDIIGHRLPNCFVDRSSTDKAAELDAIGAFAAGAGPGEALVIFPGHPVVTGSGTGRSSGFGRTTAAAERAERLTSTLLPGRPAPWRSRRAPRRRRLIVSHTGLEASPDRRTRCACCRCAGRCRCRSAGYGVARSPTLDAQRDRSRPVDPGRRLDPGRR